jgi:PIN domain nuclease of toxin-antitoxin system
MVRDQERAEEARPRVTYLDTHVAERLSRADLRSFGKESRRLLNREADIRISPIVLVELEYLYQIGRLKVRAREVADALASELGLRVCTRSFEEIAKQALHESWTRDPFDRIIVAQARLAKAPLLTRDGDILAHYNKAIS